MTIEVFCWFGRPMRLTRTSESASAWVCADGHQCGVYLDGGELILEPVVPPEDPMTVTWDR